MNYMDNCETFDEIKLTPERKILQQVEYERHN